jgi:hypothetical protein
MQRRRGVSARAVGSFVPRLTQKAMEKYGFSTAALLTDWAAIVGKDMAAFTAPMKLAWPRAPEHVEDAPGARTGRSGATLIVRVEAARALDIEYKRAQIIERINGYFGYRAVAELRVHQAPIAPLEPAKPRNLIAGGRTAKPRLDLGGIADERLRAALERLQQGIARR